MKNNLATDPHRLTQTFVRATRSDKYSHPPKAEKADQFFDANADN
ncbi:MAG: hypothetical protein SWH54_17500 [Thermodesulfobacteriota bacterium]|nr:hypothetical protein [Thermodesulfobacteriota bacterium]